MMRIDLDAEPLPTLFVPHGSPLWVLRPGAAGAALAMAAAGLSPVRAIVVVSAHWDTAAPTVGYADRPATLHDYWGFPDALYAIRYPATGCREVADEVLACLHGAGFSPELDASRGLDHGAWVPLRMMFPDADVPVVPLSIQARLGPLHQLVVGRALAPLSSRGVLILGSGNMTHNLHDYRIAREGDGVVLPYLRLFPEWMAARLAGRDMAAMLDYRRLAPDAIRAHPTDEHLLPFYLAMGAAGEDFDAQRFHAGIDEGVLAMDSYIFRKRG